MKDIITLGELLIDQTQTHMDGTHIRHFAANPGTDELEAGSRVFGEMGISLVLITLGGAGTFYRLKGAAALTCSRHGAISAMPTRAEADAKLQEETEK